MANINPWLAGLLTAIGLQSLVIGGFLYSTRTQKPEAPKPGASHAAKTVAKAEKLKDSDVKRLSLITRAAERLDIKTAPVRAQQVARKRTVEGEVLAGTVITASVAGIISLPEGASAVKPGTKLSAGQNVLRLTPASTQAAKADAVQLTAAGSPPEAIAQPSGTAAVSLQAPRDSRLVRVLVQPGQAVEPGQPLFEVADDLGALIRVPLAGDANRAVREKPVRILPINTKDVKTPAAGWTAQPAQAPRDADPKEAARALYYKVEEAGQELAPGQRVLVEVHLPGSEEQRLTVPYAAVVYDATGGTWVYTNPEPLVFVRHRINVAYIEDNLAVLSDGPPAGTAVVTDGAIELFGVEFKVGHGVN